MKKIISVLLAVLMIISLAACTPKETDPVNTQDPTDNPPATETEAPTPTPTPTPVPKLAEISDCLDIVEAGGPKAESLHGGHQTRIVHTNHGTYMAYIDSSYNDVRELGFVIVKIENNEVKTLYNNRSPSDAAGINIVHDPKTGDVYVTAVPVVKHYPDGFDGEIAWLALYVVDGKTDEVTEYKSEQKFAVQQGNGYGYSMPIVDVEQRKIYALYSSGGSLPGYFAWFTFDMDTKTWQEGNITAPSDVRYAYFYGYADGKGGAYFVGERDMPCSTVPELKVKKKYEFAEYVWDRLCLFHVKDMTKPEFERVIVHDEDYTDGENGICINIQHNQNGDVYIDSEGRMHILYTARLINYNYYNGHPSGMLGATVYHAVYDGMECVYKEPIHYDVYNEEEKQDVYTMRMMQATDGRFYILAMLTGSRKVGATVEVWKATDDLFTQFELESKKQIAKKAVETFNISSPRSFSVQDDVIDCFFNNGGNIYYFNVKLG